MIELITLSVFSLLSFKDIPNPYESIVKIGTTNSTATGFVIEVNSIKYLATNKHVCDTTFKYAIRSELSIVNENKSASFLDIDVRNVTSSEDLDLCLIKTKLNKYKSLKLGTIDQTTNILAYHPKSLSRAEFRDVKVSEVVNPEHFLRDKSVNRLVDAKIQKGMSGTPVLNSKNEVVGIVWGNWPIDFHLAEIDFDAFNSPDNIRNGFITEGENFNMELIRMTEELNKPNILSL